MPMSRMFFWLGLAFLAIAGVELVLTFVDIASRDFHLSTAVMLIVFGSGGIIFLVARKRL